MRYLVLILAVLLACICSVASHSWIDELTIVGGSPSSAIGSKGYIRNYHGHVDSTSSYRIEDPSLQAPACAPFQQRFNDYNGEYPQLTAAPGDYIQGTYLENGHVSKLELPESQSGTIFWFGSTDNSISPTLAEVMGWVDGGNGNGELLTGPLDFDDGACVEDNGTPKAVSRKQRGLGGPCKNSFKLPEDLKGGTVYTVYWVWNFSLHFGPEKKGHTEWYTSCADIKVSTGGADRGNLSARARRPAIRGRMPKL